MKQAAIRAGKRLSTSGFGKRSLASLLVFAALSGTTFAHSVTASAEEGRTFVRAYFKDLNHAHKIVHDRYETMESKYEKGYVIVNATEAEIKELEAKGYRVEADSQWVHQMAAEIVSESSGNSFAAAGIPNFSCYETVEESFAAAQAMASSRPDLATWTKIGSSWAQSQGLGGYDIRVLKLTNSAKGGSNKPKLFINSAIHAREYATAPLALAFAKKLFNGYGVDADATWILDHHEVHLLLQTNPDGRKQAETGILWRKNANTAYCGATSNSRGADLNRNFTFGWNTTNGSGSSGSQCNDTYRGPSAGSESETKAIEAYVRSLWTDRRGPNRTDAAPLDTSGIHLDIHSHGRLLLWPWGTNGAVAGNDTQLTTLGRKFAFFNNHTPQRSLDLYETDGTSDGVSYGELGVAAFTFELGTAFFEKCSYYNDTILPTNLPALVYAAKVVRTPYITPAGPDALSVAASGTASTTGVPAGTQVTLTAQVDDTRYNNSNGTEPTQNVGGAEYYVDKAPWESGAVAKSMSASDGSFNSNKEGVTATIDTTGWSSGKHMVFVRAKDASNNWGAVSAVWVNIGDGGGGTAPTANFTSTVSNLTASFTDTSTDDGTIVSRSWDFGDGSSSTAANPSHTYAAAGTYSVKLTVTDNEGKTGTTTRSVTVSSDGVTVLVNGQTVSALSGASSSWKYFKVIIPSGASNLSIKTSGGTGDADLYTRVGAQPTTSSYKCRPYASGNTETCTDAAPAAGEYYIGLRGYSAYSGVNLSVNFTAP